MNYGILPISSEPISKLFLRTLNIKRILRLSVFLAISCIAFATTAKSQIIGIDLLKKNGEAKIPFELEQGFIVVDVWLNNIIPLKMIFDTGAENTILFDKEIAKILGIRFERTIPIMGSDLDSVLMANIARNVRTRVEGCKRVKRDIIVLEENSLLLKEKLGTEINGIIGGGYFPNLVVEINYSKNYILLKHPSNFVHPGESFEEYNLDIIGNKPYLRGRASVTGEQSNELTFLLDTGAALPFLLHTNTDTTLQLPEQIMIGNVGYGLSGAIYGYRGRTKELRLGNLQFQNLVTNFQDLVGTNFNQEQVIRNGILGNILLSRFKVIIDYTRQKLYLKPNRKYNKDFEFDKSGITLFAVGPNLNQHYIVAVIEGSPSHKAGILPGDVIHKVGWRKAKNMSLQSITRKFTRKEGKKVKLTLFRGSEEIKVEFVLKEWFNERDDKTLNIF